tara:strand:+ start:2261 stop:3082 length:822 start_codon:yes stop_codon:yes gene_type:complete
MQVKDFPENEADTLATRLRDAREALNLSRAEVAKRTGIPAKSIEKFEFGTQEPSVSRVLDLANVYGKNIGEIIGQEAVAPANDPAPPTVSHLSQDAPAQIPAVVAKTADEQVMDILDELDELRTVDFQRSYRTAAALIEDFRRKVKYLEPDALLDLADARGLYRGECPSAPGLFDLFTREPEKAEGHCGNVEERILDTAILGVDLFGIDHSVLTSLASSLAEEYEKIETPGFLGSWGDHHELVPMLRPPLRMEALGGRGATVLTKDNARPRCE